ncbi:MAG: choice-of-anchor D domain-containing protein, partial [Pseudomonadota bacterium]|nr:choice-of-anchor D domain-containing protein [Pseudomonadota bacterium]
YHLAGPAGSAYASGAPAASTAPSGNAAAPLASNAAASGTAAAQLDYDGNVRPDAARTAAGANGYDIGALQFNGAPPVAGQLLVTRALAFAAVRVTPCRAGTGAPCGAAVQNVTVANPGKTPLVVTGVNVTGPGFTLLNRATGFIVAPGAVRTLGVRFTANQANAPGTPTVGTLTVNAAAPAASATVALSGMSIAPSLSVSTPALNFASARGVASASQTITVRSSGSAPLIIQGIRLQGQNAGQFALSTTCPTAPATLAVGSTCTVSVNFLAKRAGTSTTDLTVNVAAPAQRGTIELSGTVR